jgi:hypothetical protein
LGLPISVQYAPPERQSRLEPLVEMLDGLRRTADKVEVWDKIATRASAALKNNRLRIEAAQVSLDEHHLAVVAEMRTLLGWRSHQIGFLYSLDNDAILGRIAQGRRHGGSWVEQAAA